jgi:preprotein translocase subunit Sec61beta
MAKDNRVHMPSGMGGLVRYFDEYKSKITFKPGHVIIIIAVIVIIVVLLHWQGAAWLGLS